VPNPRLTNHIGEAVDAPIAGPGRDDERVVVRHGDEAGLIAPWACVETAFAVGCRENKERRECDERAAVRSRRGMVLCATIVVISPKSARRDSRSARPSIFPTFPRWAA
jgi:hypothetical protein